jgi:hypothetical protein
MIKFNTTNLFKKTSRKTDATAALSETELDSVTGGGRGMINPQPLPPCRHGGSTDPRVL